MKNLEAEDLVSVSTGDKFIAGVIDTSKKSSAGASDQGA
jgi:hypothetical protein